MVRGRGPILVYLEMGSKRTFAGALDWPGWCRGGKSPEAALEDLLAQADRYADVLRGTRLGFRAPKDVREFKLVEKLKGDATTDFGAPGQAPSVDKKAVSEVELQRFHAILRACWRALDAAVEAAEGKELRKGPRGGGREVEGIVDHVLGAEAGYLGSLGRKVEAGQGMNAANLAERTRRSVEAGLDAAAHGQVEPRGPRGGKRWTARYFVRRVAWHVLDHAWEIEDRTI